MSAERDEVRDFMAQPLSTFKEHIEGKHAGEYIRRLQVLRERHRELIPYLSEDERVLLEDKIDQVLRLRRFDESAVTSFHFLNATPYPTAGSYGRSHVPLRSAREILGPAFEIVGQVDKLTEEKMEEKKGWIHYNYHSHEYYPWAGSPEHRRKKKKKTDVEQGIEALGQGEDPEDVVDGLLS